jgi:transglutaminase/protease-like cytokinesis protein 3
VNQIAPYNYELLVSNYSAVHSNVKNLPKYLTFNVLNNPTEKNLQTLVDHLIENLSTTQDKAKVINDWIVLNIFYDLDRYNGGSANMDYRPYFYLEVLRSRLTMCGGYTDLFYVMAKMASLRVSSVTGAVANLHIWNAVWDNGQWMHIDATWGSGNYQSKKTTPNYSLKYFYKTEAEIATVANHAKIAGVYNYDEVKSPYSGY